MSYTHLLYHVVFGTKDHLPLISEEWEDDLYRYMAGIARNHKGEAVEINGMPDHTDLLVRLEPVEGIADFMRELKSGSSKWVRKTHQSKFNWQRRYGAFSVSESVSDAVRKYIRDQKKHHQMQSFEVEYKTLLHRHNVILDERYLWD